MVQNHTGYKDLERYITRTCFPREKNVDVIEKNTISGLEIIDIDTKENLLVKGSIPGKSGNLVSIQKLIKTSIYGK
jgi:hypothetical protein